MRCSSRSSISNICSWPVTPWHGTQQLENSFTFVRLYTQAQTHTHITKLLTRVHYTLHINAEMECWPPLCELIALSHTHTHSTCSSSFFVIFIQTKSMTTVPSVSLPSSSHSCPGVWTVSFHSLLYTNVKIVFHTMQSLHSITSYFHHYVLQLVPD